MGEDFERLVESTADAAVELLGLPREEALKRAREGLLTGRILYDPPWAFSVPRAGAPTEEVDRWVSEVADDMQRRDDKLSRAEAEEEAQRMLVWSHKSSSPADPVPDDVDRWLSEAADEIEFSRKVPRAEAERIARRILEERMSDQSRRRDSHRGSS